MPLFCPTRQLVFAGIGEVSAQVLDSIGAGYCAWGCFDVFVDEMLVGVQEPEESCPFGISGGTFSSPPCYRLMTGDLSFRRKPLTPEQRQARDATRRIEAEKAMRDHEAAQKAFYENRERLKAERLAREAAAKA